MDTEGYSLLALLMISELKLIPLRPLTLTNTPEAIRNGLSYNSIEDAFCLNVLFFPPDGRPLRLKLRIVDFIKTLPNMEQSKP